MFVIIGSRSRLAVCLVAAFLYRNGRFTILSLLLMQFLLVHSLCSSMSMHIVFKPCMLGWTPLKICFLVLMFVLHVVVYEFHPYCIVIVVM